MTVDETWVHHFQPETKQQSKQWKHPGPPPPTEAKTEMSAGKVMVFLDAGELLVDYLDKGHTVIAAYYADFLRQLQEKLKQIRCGQLTRGVLFHQDRTLAHTSTVALTPWPLD